MVVNKNIDKLVMLMSADWFESYSSVFFPYLNAKQRSEVKSVAKDAVENFMSGKLDYWGIDFSDERLIQTKDRLINQLAALGWSSMEVEGLAKVFEEITYDDHETTLWLFWTLTEELLNQEFPEFSTDLNADMVESLKEAYKLASEKGLTDDLEKVHLASTTKWDTYLKSLTPDLPTFISDYAETGIASLNKFRLFWAILKNKINEREQKNLVQWYLAQAKKLIDSNFKCDIPDWMVA